VDQVAGCTLINRPTVHTIYPPVAEAAFAAVHPFSSGYGPVRVLAILAGLATTLLLLVGLQRAGLDPRRAVLWAWCPTVWRWQRRATANLTDAVAARPVESEPVAGMTGDRRSA